MMRRVLVLVLLLLPRPVFPCAPAPPPGHHVEIVGEEALIVWDDARKMEHFIRRGHFKSDVHAFGFLVPTPSVPQLGEVRDEIFDALAKAREPRTVRLEGLKPFPFSILLSPFLVMRSKEAPPITAAVQVLETARVAGYDAVVLAADDPQALADWLQDHEFASRPELVEWLKPYVADKWKITAFKIAGESSELGTSAVRMSFATDRPFYPYREPSDQRDKNRISADRSLLLYLVASGPHEGKLKSEPWPRELLYRNPLENISLLEPAVKTSSVPQDPWLHAFIDSSTPRQGTVDLFFARDAAAKSYVPPPYEIDDRTEIPIPLDLIAVVAIVWFLRRRRRQRSQESA